MDYFEICPNCNRRQGWDGHPYGPCALHTCTAEENDHTPAHVRVANCPRCQELRAMYPAMGGGKSR